MKNPYDIVRDFEGAIAEYTCAPYVVAVESCSAAIFLCLQYEKTKLEELPVIKIPKITYPSVPASIVNSGYPVEFTDTAWQDDGWYALTPLPIVDSAKYLARGMYRAFYNNLTWHCNVCLSFHGHKTLAIGRGGAILTASQEERDWFKAARFDGRHECALHKDTLAFPGWNMYMTPEQAARGLELMQWIKDINILPPDLYTDLSKYEFFTKANR